MCGLYLVKDSCCDLPAKDAVKRLETQLYSNCRHAFDDMAKHETMMLDNKIEDLLN